MISKFYHQRVSLVVNEKISIKEKLVEGQHVFFEPCRNIDLRVENINREPMNMGKNFEKKCPVSNFFKL